MRRFLAAVALAIALIPLTVAPAFAERPKICFEFAFWKYCI